MIEDLELVIFDMDGLMFDSESISYKSWILAFKEYGYKLSQEVFVQTLGVNRDRTREIFEDSYGYNFPFDEVFQLRNEISKRIVSEEGVPVKKGLYEILEFLSAMNICLAVATSANRERATNFLTKANVIRYFDCIVCGDEIEFSKPNPYIFLKVVEQLSCQSENTVVLEDSELGIEAAYRAGMYPIMIPDLVQPCERITRMCIRQFNDLIEVIGFLEQ